MTPSDEIDNLIATHPDWRGAALAEARRIVLAADSAVTEDWKYMGSPTWEVDGILIVGDIFKKKVKLGFMYGASLDDPKGVFNGELGGKQRRSYELYEGETIDEDALTGLVQAAIEFNRARKTKK